MVKGKLLSAIGNTGTLVKEDCDVGNSAEFGNSIIPLVSGKRAQGSKVICSGETLDRSLSSSSRNGMGISILILDRWMITMLDG
jgi:hypothetical protein